MHILSLNIFQAGSFYDKKCNTTKVEKGQNNLKFNKKSLKPILKKVAKGCYKKTITSKNRRTKVFCLNLLNIPIKFPNKGTNIFILEILFLK